MSEKTNIAALDYLNSYDPAVGEAMTAELKRQRRNLELIASENIVSPAVMAAMGSLLTTSMQKVIRESVTTAVASALMLLRKSHARELANFSAQNTQMFSHIRVHRLTQQFTLLCSTRAIQLWV